MKTYKQLTEMTSLVGKVMKDGDVHYVWQRSPGGYDYEIQNRRTGKKIYHKDNLEKIEDKGYSWIGEETDEHAELRSLLEDWTSDSLEEAKFSNNPSINHDGYKIYTRRDSNGIHYRTSIHGQLIGPKHASIDDAKSFINKKNNETVSIETLSKIYNK